jgi:hypothetical protein
VGRWFESNPGSHKIKHLAKCSSRNWDSTQQLLSSFRSASAARSRPVSDAMWDAGSARRGWSVGTSVLRDVRMVVKRNSRTFLVDAYGRRCCREPQSGPRSDRRVHQPADRPREFCVPSGLVAARVNQSIHSNVCRHRPVASRLKRAAHWPTRLPPPGEKTALPALSCRSVEGRRRCVFSCRWTERSCQGSRLISPS